MSAEIVFLFSLERMATGRVLLVNEIKEEKLGGFMEKYNIPYVERDEILYPCITISEDAPIGKVGKYGLMWITYMKENHDYRYRHLVRMGKVNATAIEVDEEANAMADIIMKKYLKKHSLKDKSSTIEMWRLREQARMVAEEVVLMDVVNRYR